MNKKKHNIHLVAVLDTLEYLQRGGRISKTAALAGTLLSIKPLVSIVDGEVSSIGNARGLKNAGIQLTKAAKEAGEIDFSLPCGFIYSGNSDELLQKYINDHKSSWDVLEKNIPIYRIGSAIGTHVGPGAFGLAFFAKE